MIKEEIDFINSILAYDVEQICCVFSVLEWFRPVWHFRINTYEDLDDEYFEKYREKKEDYPSDGVRIFQFEKLLEKCYPDYMITLYQRHIYLIHRKDKKNDVDLYVLNHDNDATIEWERISGRLFSYPDCCIKKHCSIEPEKRKPTKKQKEMMKKKKRQLIPFAKCSEDCDREWVEEFRRIIEKYDLDVGDYYF